MVASRIERTQNDGFYDFLTSGRPRFGANPHPRPIWTPKSAHNSHTGTPPWARSRDFQFFHPKVPGPYDILEDSSKSHRDRSKKYICSYLLTEPRSCNFENRQKSSKIIENRRNHNFWWVRSIPNPTTQNVRTSRPYFARLRNVFSQFHRFNFSNPQ